jgi:membrane-bound inhibitor of C-type lysozyme
VLRPGDTVQMTFVIQNADGAGPVTVQFGTNGNFAQEATVTSQVPGNNGILNNPAPRFDPFQFAFVVPQDLNCPQGCLMRVSQPRGFGACAVVHTGDSSSIPPPEPLAAGKGKTKKAAPKQNAAKKTPKQNRLHNRVLLLHQVVHLLHKQARETTHLQCKHLKLSQQMGNNRDNDLVTKRVRKVGNKLVINQGINQGIKWDNQVNHFQPHYWIS